MLLGRNETRPAGVDLYTKVVLTAIAVTLGVLAVRPISQPPKVEAQSMAPAIYIEPGTTIIRKPDGNSLGEGKLVINLRTGEIWGFPTSTVGSLYPVDGTSKKPPVVQGVYLGRFEFSDLQGAH